MSPINLSTSSHPTPLPMCPLCAAGKTTFYDNMASVCGGDLSVAEDALISTKAASFEGSTSADVGGSLCAGGNGTLSIAHCAVSGARTTEGNGGGIYAEGDSHITIEETSLSGCISPTSGGGMSMFHRAHVELIRSSIFNRQC
jgi:hypothetical protein